MGCLQADRHQAVKHFKPRFPSTSDSSLSKASSLFAAFAFQKRSEGDVPAAGVRPMKVHSVFISPVLCQIPEHEPLAVGRKVSFAASWDLIVDFLHCAGKAKSNHMWLWQGEQQESGNCRAQVPQQHRAPSGREQSHSRRVSAYWHPLPLSSSLYTAALEQLQAVMVLGLSVTSRQVRSRMPHRRCLHPWRRLCTRDPSPELDQQPQAQASDD